MRIIKVGIVGIGVVGHALGRTFSTASKESRVGVYLYDKYKGEYQNTEVFGDCHLSFICVSVPTRADGSQDLSNIYEVLERFASQDFEGVIVLKSTVLPGTTESLQRKFAQLRIVHSPEFLRQATALSDVIEEKTLLVSGAERDRAQVIEFYSLWKRNLEFLQSADYHVTEYAKYIHNCFLATKVVWMHELKKCAGAPFDEAVRFAATMGGIGHTHNIAPGEDGFGYAGACFPKDMMAFANFLQSHQLLNQAIETNKSLRSE